MIWATFGYREQAIPLLLRQRTAELDLSLDQVDLYITLFALSAVVDVYSGVTEPNSDRSERPALLLRIQR